MKKATQKVKDYLVPHEGNEYRPHLLRPHAIAFVCMVVLVAEAAFVFGVKYVVPTSKLFGIIDANVLTDETNQNRVDNGLPALQVSPLLVAAAQDKANDMATKDYFAHTSPQGLTPWYWFEQVGYNFDYAGENLAVNFSDSQDVTTAWMNSPEHRANILDVNYTQIGIATAQGLYNGEPATYVVEEFGTPAAAPVAFVDTASAATSPSPAPAKTSPVTAAAPTKSAPVATVPAVVAIQSSSAPSVQQASVAVKGAATQTVPVAPAAAPASALVILPPATTSAAAAPSTNAAPAPVAQSNFIQRVLSDPKALANDFYFLVMIIFFIALAFNIFVNIRVQHPRLIAGGLLVIVVAGLCVMLNQNIGFIHVAII